MTDPRFATTAPLPLPEDAPITDDDVLEAMVVYGGSFVRGLAQLYQRADAVNRATLQQAFAKHWREYREVVALKRRQVRA